MHSKIANFGWKVAPGQLLSQSQRGEIHVYLPVLFLNKSMIHLSTEIDKGKLVHFTDHPQAILGLYYILSGYIQ